MSCGEANRKDVEPGRVSFLQVFPHRSQQLPIRWVTLDVHISDREARIGKLLQDIPFWHPKPNSHWTKIERDLAILSKGLKCEKTNR